MIKKIAGWIGALVAFLSLVITAVGVFVLERENDDIYREMARLDSKLEDIEGDLHRKEIACEVLEATITNGEYSHGYCK